MSVLIVRVSPGGEEVFLRVSVYVPGQGYLPPTSLGTAVDTPGTWSFGGAVSPATPGVLYFTSHIPDRAIGRADIYAVEYVLE